MPMVLSRAPLHSLDHNDQNEMEYDFLVKWYHWYHHCCHVTGSSMVPFCSLGEDNWNKVCHASIGHVILLAPVWDSHDTKGIINSTILFVHPRWLNNVQHDILGPVIPVLASHDTNGIINSTIAFANSRWSKSEATWLFQSFDTVGTGIST